MGKSASILFFYADLNGRTSVKKSLNCNLCPQVPSVLSDVKEHLAIMELIDIFIYLYYKDQQSVCPCVNDLRLNWSSETHKPTYIMNFHHRTF